jgi:hypothetical protein
MWTNHTLSVDSGPAEGVGQLIGLPLVSRFPGVSGTHSDAFSQGVSCKGLHNLATTATRIKTAIISER